MCINISAIFKIIETDVFAWIYQLNDFQQQTIVELHFYFFIWITLLNYYFVSLRLSSQEKKTCLHLYMYSDLYIFQFFYAISQLVTSSAQTFNSYWILFSSVPTNLASLCLVFVRLSGCRWWDSHTTHIIVRQTKLSEWRRMLLTPLFPYVASNIALLLFLYGCWPHVAQTGWPIKVCVYYLGVNKSTVDREVIHTSKYYRRLASPYIFSGVISY